MTRHLFIFFLFACSIIQGQQMRQTLADAHESSYNIQDSVMVKTRDGAMLSVMVVSKKGVIKPLPVVFQFTIYVRDTGRDLQSLKDAADRGYVGVMAYARGKRFSPDEINPYEFEAGDTYDVIDWISKQKWCNGNVGMYGGSYNGFTQWAACKTLHPALKTIVPYVANRPGMGLPMENNIFINPNYEWSFYVGNNKYLDNETGNDRQRFRSMMFKWWDAGAAYSKMDSIDGTPNRLFQQWISHPDFDEYWQKMAPYKEDFKHINIPVLAFDGYYNDSQNSSLYYLKELQKYSPNTPFYLIIGPYGHFGTQRGGEKEINGYKVDDTALFDINAITYEWLDYILKNGPKPSVLKDRINYEVMGANEWRSAPSFEKMHNKMLKFYLSDQKRKTAYFLDPQSPRKSTFLSQTVDFKDRKISNNNDYYPSPIEKDELDTSTGFIFTSDPLSKTMMVNGSFVGGLHIAVNKKDADLGVTLYELTPEGKYFHLSYYIGRAGYAKDITKRALLKPGEKTWIEFTNTHFVSKKLRRGSRLVVKIDVNKNPFSELNYGTGKKVSTETIKDASVPLQIRWYNDSYVNIPVWEE
ncbi:CocE/NonD family hydrolase [Chryseobacterium sp. Tr-659]|uniref:CocE/NonD family hydrolase n=1 Tax=Chryseobacterium sp. Tr-659 TaxID=2608340 RepID=UPI0014232175|nr:CocE/NonD family hydrolase [Chryseobacterium sp. Tr-659]NIF04656.1 CocE/NonD family hydrolase [Chryseobacterium sp. Tr-659]